MIARVVRAVVASPSRRRGVSRRRRLAAALLCALGVIALGAGARLARAQPQPQSTVIRTGPPPGDTAAANLEEQLGGEGEGEIWDGGARGDAGAVAWAPPPVRVEPLVRDGGVPVAVGRGVIVTAGELYDRVLDAPEPTQRAWANNPRLLEELLDRLVADRLLSNEARRLGLERDPAVRAAVERALVARLRATVINPAAGDGSRVTAEEIRAFYEAHPQRFHIPERRRALVIFTTDRRTAETALREALARGRRRRPRNPFRALVARYNTDPELVRLDGELREVTAVSTDVDPAVRDTLFAIENPGEVHPELVRGAWRGTRGYFVVRLVGRRPPIDRTLAESSDWIRQRLVLERRVQAERAMVERLAREARVARTPADRVVRVTADDAGVAPGAAAPPAR